MHAIRSNLVGKNWPQLRSSQPVKLWKSKQSHLDADSLWKANQHIHFACLFNPFVRDLAKGTLRRVDFEEYLTQDIHYLHAFSEALKTMHELIIASSPMNRGHIVDLETRGLAIRKSALLLGSVQEELTALHFKHVDLAHQRGPPQQCWATEAYTKFLVDVVKNPENSVPEIASSLLPCFRLYSELAVLLRHAVLGSLDDPRQHPYAEWILQYSSKDFADAVSSAEWLFDKYIGSADRGSQERCRHFYRTAMEKELAFFGAHASFIDSENDMGAFNTLIVGIEEGCTTWTDDQWGGVVFAERVVDTLHLAIRRGINVVMITSGECSTKTIEHALSGLALPVKTTVASTVATLPGRAKVHVVCDPQGVIAMNQVRQILSLDCLKSVYIGSSRFSRMLAEASVAVIMGPQQTSDPATIQRGTQIRPLIEYGFHTRDNSFVDVMYQTNSWDEVFGFLSASTWEPTEERARAQEQHIPRVLLISGSDSGGGAGLQADIKTCTSLGVFTTNAVTAITAQNTTGVHKVHTLPGELVRDQIRAVCSDIGTSAIKVGMLGSAANVQVVSEELRAMNCKQRVIVDPVLSSSSGASLAEDGLVESLKKYLFPLASVITPNTEEASILLGNLRIESLEEMRVAARKLYEFGPEYVLLKGGHVVSEFRGSGRMAVDVLFDGHDFVELSREYINDATNTHGTGCSLASAIASRIAQGDCMVDAIRYAKDYVWRTIQRSQGLPLGTGLQRPMNHHESFEWGIHSTATGRHVPNPIDISLYAVSSPTTTSPEKTDDEILDTVRSVVSGGVSVIQIRDKSSEGGRLTRIVSKMVRFCRPLGVKVIVNDRVDVCIAADACGVHIGQGDIPAHIVRKMIGPTKVLGVSCKTVELGRKAQLDGADYLGCGAVFDTPTKDSRTIGVDGVSRIKSNVSIPVVAIGGLDESNIEETLRATGCDGVAVVRAIFDASDVRSSTARLRDIVDRTKVHCD